MFSLQQHRDWPFLYDKRPRSSRRPTRISLALPAKINQHPPHEAAKSSATRDPAKKRPAARDSRYESSVAFCPHCYALITAGDAQCPICGGDLQEWHAKSYAERLVLALNHPLADVRLRAIIALGLRREKAAEQALVECALRHPNDVVAGLEIISSLRLLGNGAEGKHGLSRLACLHPARLIREAAQSAMRNRSKS